ncbi:hypothetical protein [Tengunoibacter tsumagoiensis]|uniref:Uncharacterized protein n=1 Tax=Tengunoibacter tsumagoiensis TaxID=2014871 RepID=A0A402A0S7_9CHLR|nr:hypothetical protein [Tengunoibacter tsumagoiensis]GCE12662.1 hypothetical protein KTT_25210 [Tengunoibacter tsumagoiensis]
MRSILLWPLVIIASTIAVGLVTFVQPDLAIRPFVVMWFLFICPGMAVVRLLYLQDKVAEWSLGIALSLSLDAIITSLFMYSGHWSSYGTLAILMWVSFCCSLVQIIAFFMRRPVRLSV